ncbi:MAG TPA: MerR family transcriptional regulator [Steroidobacteraceae bacterium]|nr:MerR family transcriptional regulator [Steroidobacteraceae bacterium]
MKTASESQSFTIGPLAAAAGVHVETIRFYQRRGLLTEPRRSKGQVRHYSDADAEQLRFIKRAKSVGFTLAEIQTLLELRSRKSCRATRALVATKLQVVEERLRDLRRLKTELAHWIAACDSNTEDSSCPAIERLAS